MNIDIILPFREKFTILQASAVSTSIKNSIINSSFKKNIKIYGHAVIDPMLPENFIGIKTNKLLHFSNNVSIIKNYLKLQSYKKEEKLIEIHMNIY